MHSVINSEGSTMHREPRATVGTSSCVTPCAQGSRPCDVDQFRSHRYLLLPFQSTLIITLEPFPAAIKNPNVAPLVGKPL